MAFREASTPKKSEHFPSGRMSNSVTAFPGVAYMAILHDGDLSLEIRYREFEYGSVSYDIWLRWRGELVINDAILKRVNDHWAKRG